MNVPSDKNSGQAMVLAIMALGGILIGATTIAGLLVYYQIQQATDITNSTMAIYAADTGLEWAFFDMFCNTYTPSRCAVPPTQPGGLGNGATVVSVQCEDASNASLACSDPAVRKIGAVGNSGHSYRALQADL